jgi:hypothetical protein
MKNPVFRLLSILTIVTLVIMVVALTDKTSVLYEYRFVSALGFGVSARLWRRYKLRNSIK